jgi:predicted component of type VI protein secretion system
MNKKPNTASALAGIIAAKRGGEETPDLPTPEVAAAPTPEPIAPPSPTPVPASPASARVAVRPVKKELSSKSTDPNYKQFSVYLRKDTRKKAGRLLEDMDTDMDFSDLTQMLLEQWIKANT